MFHRDIKPENVLVSDEYQVYLIDFGLARIGGKDLAMSSVVAGTFGFMAPEQLRNQQLTAASDLYGLGLTLVCVIANLRSHQIGEYVDYNNQLDQKAIEAKLQGCSLRFIQWLTQLVAPDPKKRFPDAATALAALKPLYVKRTPQVMLEPNVLTFQATQVGETLRQTITVTNPIPETLLEGYWEVAPHPNDPPHSPDRHPWISISPKTVRDNQVICSVTVDTGQLQIERQGSRQLVFHSNADLDKVTVPIQIKTASNLAPLPTSLYLKEALHSGFILIMGGLLSSGLVLAFFIVGAGVSLWLLWGGALAGVVAVLRLVVARAEDEDVDVSVRGWVVAGAVAGAVAGLWLVVVVVGSGAVARDVALPLAVAVAMPLGMIASSLKKHYHTLPDRERRHAWIRFWVRYFLALVCGGGIGAGLVAGFAAHLLIPVAALGAGAGLVYISIAPMLNRRRQLAAQRRQEHRLIEP